MSDYNEEILSEEEGQEENTGMMEALMLLVELGEEKEISEDEMFRQEQIAEELRAKEDGQLSEILARIYRKLMLRRRKRGGTVSLAIARTFSQVELSLWQAICEQKPEMETWMDTVRCCMEMQVSYMLSGTINEQNQKEIRAILRKYGQKVLDGNEKPEPEEMIRLLDVMILADVQERTQEGLERAEKICMMRLEAGAVYREDDENPEHLDVLANGYIIFGNVLREMKKREDAIRMLEMGCALHKKAFESSGGHAVDLLEDYLRLADTIAEKEEERMKALTIERRAMILASKIPQEEKDSRFLENMCKLYTDVAILLAQRPDADREKCASYAQKAVEIGERLMEIHPTEKSYAMLMKAMYIAGKSLAVSDEQETYYRERAEMYMEYADGTEASYCS